MSQRGGLAMETMKSGSVDAGEVARFNALAADWWNPKGSMAPLHVFNPVRLSYIREKAAAHFGLDAAARRPLAGKTLLDVGCGGGILSEPMARLGAKVTGLDPAEENIGVAKLHAEEAGLSVDYRAETVEAVVARGERFDIVLAMEVVEHVADVPAFVKSCCEAVAPGGLLFMATLNRTMKSYALAIVGAEYILRWLPRGTHDWNKFVTPRELEDAIAGGSFSVSDVVGVVYNPLTGAWSESRDTDVNYMLVAK